jgi:hypothetical protein
MLVGLTLGIDGRVGLPAGKDGGRGHFVVGARIGGLYGPSLGACGLPDGQDATAGPMGG